MLIVQTDDMKLIKRTDNVMDQRMTLTFWGKNVRK